MQILINTDLGDELELELTTPARGFEVPAWLRYVGPDTQSWCQWFGFPRTIWAEVGCGVHYNF